MWLVFIGQAQLEIWRMEDVICCVVVDYLATARFLLIFVIGILHSHTLVIVLLYYR